MINLLGCPPCASISTIGQWFRQKKNISSLDVTGIKNRLGDLDAHSNFEQTNAPVNIFHSLFKIIESKNV